jgi:hypothetical protein
MFREEDTMKKALLVAIAILFVASAVNAVDLPQKGYIGLWTCPTAGPGATYSGVCSASATFRMAIWVLPSVRGMFAAEFKLTIPTVIVDEEESPIVVISAIVKNPGVTSTIGSLEEGITLGFLTCQMNYVWVEWMKCTMMVPGAPGIITINPDPTAIPPFLGIATCGTGLPKETIKVWQNMYLNQTCFIGTKDASWGAIKSLF